MNGNKVMYANNRLSAQFMISEKVWFIRKARVAFDDAFAAYRFGNEREGLKHYLRGEKLLRQALKFPN